MKRLFFILVFIVTTVTGGYLLLPSVGWRWWHAHMRYEQMAGRFAASQNTKDVQTQLAKTQTDYDNLTDNLPTAANFPAFLNMILNEGQKNDLQFTRVTKGEPQLKAGLNEIPVQLAFSGGYQQFLNFLKTLQEKNYFIIIDTISMTRQLPPVTTVLNPENTPDKLLFTVTAYFYYLP